MTPDCQPIFKFREWFRLLSVGSKIQDAYGKEMVYSYQRFKYIGYNLMLTLIPLKSERYKFDRTLTHKMQSPDIPFFIYQNSSDLL